MRRIKLWLWSRTGRKPCVFCDGHGWVHDGPQDFEIHEADDETAEKVFELLNRKE